MSGLWRGSKDCNIQDQVTKPFRYHIMQELKNDISLTSPISIGDTTISVSSGHGFTTGGTTHDYLIIWENGYFEQLKVIGVATNDITVNIPFLNAFSMNSVIIRGKIDLNQNGSVTPVNAKFKFYGPEKYIPIDIKFAKIIMVHPTEGDDISFGDITALLDGSEIYFTKNGDNVNINLGNYQNNGDFKEFGWNVDYLDKAGGGEFSTTCEIDIIQILGVVLRLNPRENDELNIFIRSNLSALSKLRMIAYGQYTEGE